jgi:hypothetical protein
MVVVAIWAPIAALLKSANYGLFLNWTLNCGIYRNFLQLVPKFCGI